MINEGKNSLISKRKIQPKDIKEIEEKRKKGKEGNKMRPQKKFTRKNYPVKIFNPGVDMDITHLHIILGHTSRVSFCIGNIIDGLQMNAKIFFV